MQGATDLGVSDKTDFLYPFILMMGQKQDREMLSGEFY